MERNGKLPPQALDAEIAVLGAILLDKDALLEVVDVISEKAFYKEAHGKIYAACLSLNNSSQPIDMVTVCQQLMKDKNLDVVGGMHFISQLSNRVASASNIEHHARIMEEQYIKRNIISGCSELIVKSYDNGSDTFEIVDEFLTKAYEVGDINSGETVETNVEILRRLKKNIEEAKDKKGLTGLSTGINKIDELYGGYQKSHLIIKAGRPAMGKTAQAMCEANHIANNCDKNVLFFSLEMSAIELMQRIVSVNSNISINKLKEGTLSPSDWEIYNNTTSNLMSDNLRIIDKAGMPLNYIKKTAKKYALKHGLDAIYIDYLQLISNNVKGGNREQEISSISRGLKQLAKELDVPIIALSQLSRNVESRPDKRPMLSDLRESGSIEQDADSVQFLYRPEYYGLTEDEEGNSTVGVGYLMIAKNRHGALKDIPMRFIPECTSFTNMPGDESFNPSSVNPMPMGEGFDIPTSSGDSKENDSDKSFELF